MRTKNLVALLVLLAGMCQLVIAQDALSKNVPEKKDKQGKAAAKKNAPAPDAKDKTEKPDIHEFVIANFKTESGVTLPQAHVVYGTYGHLNAARDNVVLLPSHYMADCHGYEWLIGPDRALDASKLCLVATRVFGIPHSSSPS